MFSAILIEFKYNVHAFSNTLLSIKHRLTLLLNGPASCCFIGIIKITQKQKGFATDGQ